MRHRLWTDHTQACIFLLALQTVSDIESLDTGVTGYSSYLILIKG